MYFNCRLSGAQKPTQISPVVPNIKSTNISVVRTNPELA